MIEFKINGYLSLRLEKGKTNIYVNNKLFRQCKYLLLNIDPNEREIYKDIKSIDEAVESLNKTLEFRDNKQKEILPNALFWGHCSVRHEAVWLNAEI